MRLARSVLCFSSDSASIPHCLNDAEGENTHHDHLTKYRLHVAVGCGITELHAYDCKLNYQKQTMMLLYVMVPINGFSNSQL